MPLRRHGCSARGTLPPRGAFGTTVADFVTGRGTVTGTAVEESPDGDAFANQAQAGVAFADLVGAPLPTQRPVARYLAVQVGGRARCDREAGESAVGSVVDEDHQHTTRAAPLEPVVVAAVDLNQFADVCLAFASLAVSATAVRRQRRKVSWSRCKS